MMKINNKNEIKMMFGSLMFDMLDIINAYTSNKDLCKVQNFESDDKKIKIEHYYFVDGLSDYALSDDDNLDDIKALRLTVKFDYLPNNIVVMLDLKDKSIKANAKDLEAIQQYVISNCNINKDNEIYVCNMVNGMFNNIKA